ncbi:MAG: hypothetical protein IK093_18050 [Ruminiclostridium sp.]|nr:hypothetical protein [Ruminiclostridium sp.]
MKKLKTALSFLLVGVIAVTSLFCGTVTASAASKETLKLYYQTSGGNLNIFIDGFDNPDYINGLYYYLGLTFDSKSPEKSFEYKLLLSYEDFYDNEQKKVTLTRKEGENEKKTNIYFSYYFGTGDLTNGIKIEITESTAVSEITDIVKNAVTSWPRGSTYNSITFAAKSYTLFAEINPISSSSTYTKSDSIHRPKTNVASDPKDLSTLTYAKIPDQVYTGKEIRPDVTIKEGDRVLNKGIDYALMYDENEDIGTAIITVFSDEVEFIGEKEIEFKIVPAKTTLTAKKSGGKFVLSWKSVNGGITKYQIQYSIDGGKTY